MTVSAIIVTRAMESNSVRFNIRISCSLVDASCAAAALNAVSYDASYTIKVLFFRAFYGSKDESATVKRSHTVLPSMQPICTHTISVQSAKLSHAYPIIRLPREFRDLAGSKAAIYQTVHDGKLAFLVTTKREVDNCCLLASESESETRLSTLENEISDLKAKINTKESVSSYGIKKQKAEGEIRTRVVASTGP